MFENLEKQILEFEYDVYYKKMGQYLKEIQSEEEFLKEKRRLRKEVENALKIDKTQIDIQELKQNFASILLNENSSEILWMLNSIFIDEDYKITYLDMISDVFKKANQAVRKGVNIYKANGWMTHSLYVYQIANKNIAKNIVPNNFKTDEKKIDFIEKCFAELHQEYLELDNTSRFIFKLTALIHDIGVAYSVKEHGYHGQKFVDQVLKDIGISDIFLKENHIETTLENLSILEKAILKDHTIYTGVSSEFSDKFVDKRYRELMEKVEIANFDKKKVTSILYMFTVCDVIGVTEAIFDEQKIKMLKEAKKFFYEIIENKEHDRDKKEIAAHRIGDLIGVYDIEKIKKQSEDTMLKFNIDSQIFWERLYYAGQFWFFLAIMKEIAVNFEFVIRTLNCIFEVTVSKYGEQAIEDLATTWIPNNHEKQAIKNMEDETFFKAMDLLRASDKNTVEYGKNKLSICKKDGKVQFEIEIL